MAPKKPAPAKRPTKPVRVIEPLSREQVDDITAEFAAKEVSINAEADRIINGQRRDDYGPAKESFEKIATGWSVILGTEVSAHQVALAMVWLKTCRALQGFHRDSFVDICGYAGLAEVLNE